MSETQLAPLGVSQGAGGGAVPGLTPSPTPELPRALQALPLGVPSRARLLPHGSQPSALSLLRGSFSALLGPAFSSALLGFSSAPVTSHCVTRRR